MKRSLQAAIRYYNLRASWLGDGAQPVATLLAQTRANTCLTCPFNDSTQPIYELVTATVATELRRQVELKSQLQLHVDGEDKLHVCRACGCHLALKVHVPLRHILSTTDTSTLHPGCWITSEQNAQSTPTPSPSPTPPAP